MWLCFCVALCVAWGTSLWFYLRVAPLDMCDMIHAYVRHDSFICVTGLIQICDMTHWSVWRDSCVWHGSECDVIHVCDTWMMSEWMMNDECDVIHVCDMAHIWCVWHGSYLRLTRLMQQVFVRGQFIGGASESLQVLCCSVLYVAVCCSFDVRSLAASESLMAFCCRVLVSDAMCCSVSQFDVCSLAARVRMFVCMYVYMYQFIHRRCSWKTLARSLVYVCMYVCMYVCFGGTPESLPSLVFVCMRVFIHVCAYINMHAYMNTHKLPFSCIPVLAPPRPLSLSPSLSFPLFHNQPSRLHDLSRAFSQRLGSGDFQKMVSSAEWHFWRQNCTLELNSLDQHLDKESSHAEVHEPVRRSPSPLYLLTYIYMYICMYMLVHIYIHVYMYIYVHIYMYIHMYI